MYRFQSQNFDRDHPRYLPWWRRSVRRLMYRIARLLLPLLSRPTITGVNHFPDAGPYVVAGNHRGIMEVALMLAVVPRPIEIIGAGDIPLDRRYRYFAHWYGFIPYQRGLLDRAALRTARRVLETGGVVGIFPEGGIWQTGRKGVQRGVAWLSVHTGAPVVPVGFGGVAEGVHKTVTLQHPVFAAHIGQPIPASGARRGASARHQLEQVSVAIMEHIDQLVPEWDRVIDQIPAWEQDELIVEQHRQTEPSDAVSARSRVDADLYRPDLISRLLHMPVLINTIYYNLNRRSVAPLRKPGRWFAADRIQNAVGVVLGFSRYTNPAYFSYRLGAEYAAELDRALASLYGVAGSVAAAGGSLRLIPVKRIRNHPEGEIHEYRKPTFSRRL